MPIFSKLRTKSVKKSSGLNLRPLDPLPNRFCTAPFSDASIALCSSLTHQTHKYGLPPAYDLLLAACKRASRTYCQLFAHFVFLQLVPHNIFRNSALVFSYSIYIIPLTPKLSVAVFVLQFAELLIQHRAAFFFSIAHKT